MNLYTQDSYYFSADEAYSFHMGITQRLQGKHQNEFKHIIEELPLDIDRIKSISRRLNRAAQDLNEVVGVEDLQGIGLTCRESLIELGNALCEDNPDILTKNNLKASDFKGIANAVVAIYASGKTNKNLRKHCRKMAEMAWEHSSEIVHSSNKNIPDAKICLLFTCSAVSIFQNLYLKYLGFDAEPKCPECKSLDLDILNTENETHVVVKCKSCDFEEIVEVEIIKDE